MRLFGYLSFLYLMLALLGIIQFELWSQVEYIHDNKLGIVELLEGGISAHFSRYILVMPLYFMSEFFEVDANYMYSILCTVMIIIVAKVLTQVYEQLGFSKGNYVEASILLFFIILSLMMNGRIVFALLAYSIIIREAFILLNSYEKKWMSSFLLICLSLWMSSVSSGTFTIVYVFLLYLIIFLMTRVLITGKSSVNSLIVMCTYTLVLFTFSILFFIFLEKNINYYGSFWSMLEHGFGRFIAKGSTEMVGLVMAVVFSLFIFCSGVYLLLGKYKHLFIALLLGLMGGMFGYSTLALGIVPGIVLAIIFINKIIALNGKRVGMVGDRCFYDT